MAQKASHSNHRVAHGKQDFGAVRVKPLPPLLICAVKRTFFRAVFRTESQLFRIVLAIFKMRIYPPFAQRFFPEFGIFPVIFSVRTVMRTRLCSIFFRLRFFQYRGNLQFPTRQNFIADTSLVALRTRRVKDAPHEIFRQILLCHPMIAVRVRIQIPRAVPEAFRVAAGIFEMIRHLRILFLNGSECVEKRHAAVRFGSSCKIQSGVRKKITPLRHSDTVKGFRRAVYNAHRIRVGKSRVLARRNKHPPEDKMRVFAGGNHARKPIHRSVRIAPAQTFYKRADNVVVIVAVAVVKHGFFLNRLFGCLFGNINRRTVRRLRRNRGGRPFFRRRFNSKFQRIQKAPRIPVCRFD